MSGLLRRIRRPGAAEETRTEPIAPAPAHGSAPANPATGEDGQRLPAGIAPEDVERRAVTGRRGKLRRRARFLRKARELALRDLGGLVYEARRREQDPGKLAQEKVDRLIALDAELTEIEAVLGVARGATVVREPGVGGTCARCGELHPSDATFCAKCGANLAEAAREAAAAEAERRAAAEKAAAEQAAAERAAADKAAAEKTEAEKAETPKTEAEVEAESAQAEAGKPGAAQAESVQAEAGKSGVAQAEASQSAAENAGAAKPARKKRLPRKAAKAEAAKAAAEQTDDEQAAVEAPAADKADAEQAPTAEQAAAEKPAGEPEGAGNGRVDSEAPTEVAEPATSRDRSA